MMPQDDALAIKNTENETIFLCLEIAIIERGDQFRAGENGSGRKIYFCD